MEYDCGAVPAKRDDTYRAILESVRADFSAEGVLIPTTLGMIETGSMPKEKSPGLPWTSLGYRTKREAIEDNVSRNLIHGVWGKVGNGVPLRLPDAQVFMRAQICSRDEDKIRAVWGYPLEVFLEEARFVYPYLDWIRHIKRDIPVAYGIEMACGGMGYINVAFERLGPHARCAMMDWRRFDKRIPA